MASVARKNLGSSDPRAEYTNATSIVNRGPNNKAGKLYPTESEALHASSRAISTTDVLSPSRAVSVVTWYSTAPSNIPKMPKEIMPRLPRYSPTAIKNAGIAADSDAPTYVDTRLVRSIGTELVFSRDVEQYPANA